MGRSKIYALLVVSFGLQTCAALASEAGVSHERALAPLGLVGATSYFLTESPHHYALRLRGLFNRAIGTKVRGNLHEAAARGDLERTRECIASGADVNSIDGDQRTPLHLAAYNGQAKVVRLLLGVGAAYEVIDKNSKKPLRIAAANGHISVIQALLEAGADIHGGKRVLRDERTPLHAAAACGRESVVRMLLEAGANPDAVLKEEGTPLHCAAKNGWVSIVKVLLEAKATVNFSGEVPTPLHEAVLEGHVNVVRLLLRAGANYNARSSYNYGTTPLHCAAIMGHASLARMLLEAGVSTDDVCRSGETPLHLAAKKGHASVVQILLKGGASPDAVCKNGETPLHLAAREGNEKTVQLLCDRGVEIDVTDSNGRTPLLQAVRNGHVSVIRVLLEAGAVDINFRYEGYPLLHLVAYGGLQSLIQSLLRRGFDVHAVDDNGKTALWNIVKQLEDPDEYEGVPNDCIEGVCKELVARGAELTQQIKDLLKSVRGQQLLEECENLAEARLKSVKQWLQQTEEGCLPQDLVHRCAEIMLPSSQVAQLKHLRSTS